MIAPFAFFSSESATEPVWRAHRRRTHCPGDCGNPSSAAASDTTSSRRAIRWRKGYGKTTHLLVLATQVAHGAYIHIPEGQRVTVPSTGDPLLIDEAQRLTRIQRWLIFRSRRRLILGTHEDFEQPLRRASRPVLTIAADRFTNEVRVHTLLNARVQSARRTEGPIPSVTLRTASRLFTQFGSDIRSIEHSMYQTFQLLRDIQDV